MSIAIWNHAAPVSSLSRPSPTAAMPNDTGNTSQTSSDSATISANDFLTLLVTEMQNQDPTADTDPNEYINQLVNVNSLEQLISINQTLTGDTGTASGTGGSEASPGAQAQPSSSAAGMLQTPASIAAPTATPATEGGNLSIPATGKVAERVAHALGGCA